MKLELKHLAPYLPYSLKCWVKDFPLEFGKPPTNGIHTMHSLYFDGTCTFHHLVESEKGFQEIKPILRPLSDLTEEIEHNGKKFIPTELLDSEDYPIDFIVDTQYEYMICWINSVKKDHHILFLPWGLINQLVEWHFDIFNLIENNLAININTLKSVSSQ